MRIAFKGRKNFRRTYVIMKDNRGLNVSAHDTSILREIMQRVFGLRFVRITNN